MSMGVSGQGLLWLDSLGLPAAPDLPLGGIIEPRRAAGQGAPGQGAGAVINSCSQTPVRAHIVPHSGLDTPSRAAVFPPRTGDPWPASGGFPPTDFGNLTEDFRVP